MTVLVSELCSTPLNPMDCRPLDSCVRTQEWVAIPFSRGSSWPMDRTHIFHSSCIGWQILYHWATWEALTRSYLNTNESHLWSWESLGLVGPQQWFCRSPYWLVSIFPAQFKKYGWRDILGTWGPLLVHLLPVTVFLPFPNPASASSPSITLHPLSA